ncbi:unnamed protein product [Polarella glacialis]|uniref:Uncharacterized protein n=1 Tax=Polarella glacialis TaxID=89957 RepID=A0A813KLE7_POLGL|nr:unnamed protein product [Polarella glacialis]
MVGTSSLELLAEETAPFKPTVGDVDHPQLGCCVQPQVEEQICEAVHLALSRSSGSLKRKVYAPILGESRNGRLDLSDMSTVAPDLWEGQRAKYPGHVVFELVTPASWQAELSRTYIDTALDLLDLQSDVVLCLALFSDPEFNSVPDWFKIAFASVSASSILLEVLIAMRRAAIFASFDRVNSDRQHERVIGWRWWRAYFHCIFLNYLGIPVDFMVAPFRFSRFGHHPDGRNVGSRPGHDLPINYVAHAAIEGFITGRRIISKIPKLLLEDGLLFWMTVYI